jgi:predicted ATPase
MIARFSVTNFKNLRTVENLNFGPVNVFIGPNGSGKSSLLQAIDFLRAFFESSVEVYLREREWDYRDLPNLRESHKKMTWRLEADLTRESGEPDTFRYLVSLSPRRYLGVGEERLERRRAGEANFTILLDRRGRSVRLLNEKTGQREPFQEVGLPASLMSRLEPRRDHERYPDLLRFSAWVRSFRSFLLWDPKILRRPDRGKYDTLGPSGEHLAPLLARLRREKPQDFQRLVNRVRRLFPTVSDISVQGGRTWGWQTLCLHESNGQAVIFNSQQMSDGVLRLLAVTSLLYLDRVPAVVTFEEPENGVHPQLLREVVQVLRELPLRKPPNRCQVFFTTHSPYVLDEFYDHSECVFLVERGRPLEGTSVTRLADRPDVKIVRHAFEHSLGEAWVNGLLGATSGMKP